MKVFKRLFQYALTSKKLIIAALVMLAIGVIAELTGPFIAKDVIDHRVSGIQSPWYETKSSDKEGVTYRGHTYKREAYFDQGEQKGKEIKITVIGHKYYYLENPIEVNQTSIYKEGTVSTKTANGQMESSSANPLKISDLVTFYAPEIPKIITALLIYMGLLLGASVFQYGQNFYLQKSANRIIQKMRLDVFKQIQRMPIRYFDNLPAGKVVARITNDTEAIHDLYVAVLSNFFSSGVYIVGIYIALFLLNAKMALACLILIPILVIWTVVYKKFASKYNHVIRAKNSEINATINESIQGMTVVQAFRRENQMLEEFEDLNRTHYLYQTKMLRLDAYTSHNMVALLRTVAFVGMIWYFGGGTLQISSFVTLGVLYAFVDYINRLFQPVIGIVNQFAKLQQALVAGERVFSLLDKPGVDVDDNRIERYKGEVQFHDVSFGYNAEHQVLKNINIHAKQGETVALVGHTGSGKSSILNLLFRFYDSTEGRITIDGKDITEMSTQSLRKHMAIVLQDPYLFTGTIASNVSLDDASISREQVEKALAAVGAENMKDDFENGYDEPVIEKGSTLSSGQRQLISFARALAFDPAILILDEATSNIDTETEAVIQRAMNILKKGRTTFIIAHRLSTIKDANQIIVLDKGEIIEQGSHEELLELKGKYYQMYRIQQMKSA